MSSGKNVGKPGRAADANPNGGKSEASNPAQPATPHSPAAESDPTKRTGNHNVLPRKDPSGARGNEDRRGGAEIDKTKR